MLTRRIGYTADGLSHRIFEVLSGCPNKRSFAGDNRTNQGLDGPRFVRDLQLAGSAAPLLQFANAAVILGRQSIDWWRKRYSCFVRVSRRRCRCGWAPASPWVARGIGPVPDCRAKTTGPGGFTRTDDLGCSRLRSWVRHRREYRREDFIRARIAVDPAGRVRPPIRGARCRVRTCDFLRVKQALYH